jgi:hypothetical protein
MKTLKFKTNLVQIIWSGKKISTWRLFDDEDLQEGDELTLMDSETQEAFGNARIRSVNSKKLGELTDEDWEGHEVHA